MAKVTLRTLKQYLAGRSDDELRDDIVALFGKFDAVKDYYQVQLSDDDEAVRAKYRAIIEREFTPARGFPRMRLAVARKAITDYARVSNSVTGRIELMLAYVEAGVRCTNTYGDLTEQFYRSMESMYQSAVKLIVEQQLQPTYERRCWQIVQDTRNVGWGFHDELGNIYAEAFDG